MLGPVNESRHVLVGRDCAVILDDELGGDSFVGFSIQTNVLLESLGERFTTVSKPQQIPIVAVRRARTCRLLFKDMARTKCNHFELAFYVNVPVDVIFHY
jgi:hypothetical protein